MHRPTDELFKKLIESKDFSKCKGCVSAKFMTTSAICLFLDVHKTNAEGSCPCTSCIIKPMCSDACPKFQNLYNPD